MIQRIKEWAHRLKLETYALYMAVRDPEMPWYAKAFGALIVAYALSPIDLIPDFIPVLGYLDDLVIIPLGLVIAVRLVPPAVMARARARSAAEVANGALSVRSGAWIVAAIWLAVLGLVVFLAWRWVNK